MLECSSSPTIRSAGWAAWLIFYLAGWLPAQICSFTIVSWLGWPQLGWPVAGAACAGPAFFPGTFTTDPLVVREMHKLVPLMFLLILPHPLTMCFEGVLLACRDIRYLTVIYAANTLAVAAIMRVVAKTSASTSAVWAGLIAWNTARFLEEGTRILARARRLVGVPITEVLFGKKGVPARRSSGQAGL